MRLFVTARFSMSIARPKACALGSVLVAMLSRAGTTVTAWLGECRFSECFVCHTSLRAL
jgi:hypothetical protein